MRGIIIGFNEDGSVRVLLYNKLNKSTEFIRKTFSKEEIISLISTGKLKLDNATVVDGKLKGLTGNLSRFKSNKIKPLVVVSAIEADDKIIGYRVASYEGKITAFKLRDILDYCERVNKYAIPIQNMQYVTKTDGVEAHLRLFPGQEIYTEVINRKRANTAVKANNDSKENEKKLSRIEELFNPAQIKELKLGKMRGVDIRIFGNNKLSAGQMHEIRRALEDGIDARVFADPAYSIDSMKALRINAKYGVDISYFSNPKYNAEQIFELSTGYLSGVDITQYADPRLTAKEMSKKRILLESSIWNEIEATEM